MGIRDNPPSVQVPRLAADHITVDLPSWWALLGAVSADPAVHDAYRNAAVTAQRAFVEMAVSNARMNVQVRTIHTQLINADFPSPGICTECWDNAADGHASWPCATIRAMEG